MNLFDALENGGVLVDTAAGEIEGKPKEMASSDGTFNNGESPIHFSREISPALYALGGEMKDLRDKAKAEQQDYNTRRAEIERDNTLSDMGKEAELADLKSSFKRRMLELRDAEKNAVNAAIEGYEKTLDGNVGYGPSERIAYRDAFDRAESIDPSDSDRAAEVMRRALRTGDSMLAHALFRVALRNGGWSEARTLFAKENPNVAQAASDLGRLRNMNTFDRAMAYWYED